MDGVDVAGADLPAHSREASEQPADRAPADRRSTATIQPQRPPGLSDRFPALDGCRAVAAFGVVLVHVGILSGFTFRSETFGPYLARADIGVSVFFALSGFLLYRPFVIRRLAGAHQGDAGQYARRRLLRIFPAYWVALTIVAFVLEAPPFQGAHSIVAHYLLLHVYDPQQVVVGPIDQAWSLATEIAFYLFLPFWAWLLARGARGPDRQIRREVWSLVLLWGGCMALNLAVIAMGVSGPRFGQFGTWLPFRVHEFVFGMALAVASAWIAHRRIELPAWTGAPLTLASWGLAVVLFWLMATRMGFPLTLDYTPMRALAQRLIYSLISLFVVLPLVLGRQDHGPARRLLANPVAVWFGLVSYGIYIWHKAIQRKYLDWTGQEELQASFSSMLVFTVVLSVAVAALSWYLIERPLVRRRDRVPAASGDR